MVTREEVRSYFININCNYYYCLPNSAEYVLERMKEDKNGLYECVDLIEMINNPGSPDSWTRYYPTLDEIIARTAKSMRTRIRELAELMQYLKLGTDLKAIEKEYRRLDALSKNVELSVSRRKREEYCFDRFCVDRVPKYQRDQEISE